MQNLESPENFKPIMKAHLFLHKVRKVNIMDREIRQKWLKLQKEKLQQQQLQVRDILDIQRLRQLKQNQLMKQNNQGGQPQNRIVKIRSDIIRQQAHLRKKQYDQIFYRKHKRNHTPQMISPSNQFKTKSFKNEQKVLRIITEEKQADWSPIILRKRHKRKQRQLSIIRNRYEDGIRAISCKKLFEDEKVWDNHKQMLRKLKGTKFYYKFASSWQP